MPAPYRVAEAILALLQFASMAMLSAGSLRLRHWLIVPAQQAYPANSGFSDSFQQTCGAGSKSWRIICFSSRLMGSAAPLK